MNSRDDFYLKIAHSLLGCQLVEQELKMYISDAFEFARKAIGDRMSFSMSGKDYEGSSLEGLIKIFRKLNENKQLVDDLQRFRDERNFLGHTGISDCLDGAGDPFEPAIVEVSERLRAMQEEALRLRKAIHAEASHFRALLDFDDR